MTYSLNPPVEAFSLSSLTAIASNPPSHPKATSANGTPPLVLYIARVPGSRDVFLTPMKPREKVVTAEDVQSSLYYIHINTTQDLETLQEKRPSSANADASRLASINEISPTRKPVPPPRSPLRRSPVARSTPPYPTENEPLDLQAKPPYHSNCQIARKPVLSDITNTSPTRTHSLGLPDIPRRPLPPPPSEDPDFEGSLHAESTRLLRRSEHSSEVNPYLREFSPPAPTTPVPEAGSLTLIRRDPASSSQWNVASIYDPPVQEVSSAALLSPTAGHRVKKGGSPLYIDMTNPGYLQFVSAVRPGSRTSTSTESSGDEPAPENIFRRRLYMPGSKYADHSYSNNSAPSATSLRPTDAIPTTLRNRTSVDASPYPNLTPPSMDRRSKGYSFLSPWDGRCDFSTSTSGRALKCRHTLPEHQGGSAEVSELRFNLPTSSRPSSTLTPTAEKRASYFTGLHRRMRSEDSWGGGPSPDRDSGLPSYIFDEEGNIDLSLGQERAGGGFGGKQAKLGKLIIYPEGTGMLDLLVAANIGLWWRAWDRV